MILDDMFARSTKLTEEHKKVALSYERPTPDLHIIENDSNFLQTGYAKYPWLIGSIKFSALFCLPCILFAQKTKSCFTNAPGYKYSRSPEQFMLTVETHQKSQIHMQSMLCYVSVKSLLQPQIDRKTELDKHNANCQRDRQIIKQLVKAASYLATHELAYDGIEASTSATNFTDLLSILSEDDYVLRCHLLGADNSSFTGISESVQNGIYESIASVILKRIVTEVNSAQFVSIMLDESVAEGSNHSELTIILRYLDDNSLVRERLVGFTDVTNHRSADELMLVVLEAVQAYSSSDKLIAHCYTGTAVKGQEIAELRAIMKENFPTAVFVHCFTYKLNAWLVKSLSSISRCDKFFKTITSVDNFFCESPKRKMALASIAAIRDPSTADAAQQGQSSMLGKVEQHKTDLIRLFQSITIDNVAEWDSTDYNLASGLLTSCQKFEFIFLLTMFSEVFPVIYDLIENLQKTKANFSTSQKLVDQGLQKLIEYRKSDQFKVIFADTTDFCYRQHEFPDAVLTMANDEYREELLSNFDAIMGILITELGHFSTMEDLDFFNLLDSTLFPEYNYRFPTELFDKFITKYHGDYHNAGNNLRLELSSIYGFPAMDGKTILDIMMYINQSELNGTFSALTKLCQFFLTFPGTSSAIDGSLPIFQRLKSKLAHQALNDRLQNLTIIATHASIVSALKAENSFYDAVIDDFATRNAITLTEWK